MFDKRDTPNFPTFGFKLLEKDPRIIGLITFLKEMFYTMLEAHGNEHQGDSNSVRTIPIPSKGVSPLAFNLSKDDKQQLFHSGRKAAKDFFKEWDFEEYRKKFRECFCYKRDFSR